MMIMSGLVLDSGLARPEVSRMDSTAAAPLDLDRFRKLLARSRSTLHGGGADPERDSARRIAERMAQDASLTFEAAVDIAEGRTEQRAHEVQTEQADSWFSDFMRDIFEERESASRHPFPEHEMERALREALVGFDLTGLGLFSEQVPDAAIALIRTAIPWPRTLRAAIYEITAWDRLQAERDKIADCYRLGDAALLRRFMLREHVLQGRAASVSDAVARAQWIGSRSTFETLSVGDTEDGLQIVTDDLVRMAERVRALTSENHALKEQLATEANRPVRRTNTQKRRAVEAVLSEPGADSLSLRQIADRAGVSPETARSVKRERT
ncbi:hypothetical protein CTI14_00565 [Methylobacterium radiotolerans]|nr:hypothetical protein CTI14_00565 [Methylobacterium radiotolerans]